MWASTLVPIAYARRLAVLRRRTARAPWPRETCVVQLIRDLHEQQQCLQRGAISEAHERIMKVVGAAYDMHPGIQ